MRLKECEVWNFGSYAHLAIDFSQQGLTLAYGPTGAGKSTIMDVSAWILYGITAKGGNADEVRSWTAPNEGTKGVLHVEPANGTPIIVTRVRGPSPRDNDLFWTESIAPNGAPKRGKDLQDTQKLLELRLAVSADLFLISAYFHEFSNTGAFFSAKAKDRREVFEKIANLSFPTGLGQAAQLERKGVRVLLNETRSECDRLAGAIRAADNGLKRLVAQSEQWKLRHASDLQETAVRLEGFEREKASKIEAIKTKHDAFVREREKSIDRLLEGVQSNRKRADALGGSSSVEAFKQALKAKKEEKCKECGGPKASKEVEALQETIRKLEKLEDQHENLLNQLADVSDSESPYDVDFMSSETNHYAEQLRAKLAEVNPLWESLKEATVELNVNRADLFLDERTLNILERKQAALLQLQDLASDMKGIMLQKAVGEVQESTNQYLERYFDGEIKVSFALEGADDLTVSIQKSGYDCVYRQLSKGQRQMLKLCFALSVMEIAANNAGISFDTLYLDEPTDGLSTELKIKAYGMLEELSLRHPTVLVIDHSEELRQLFINKIKVSLVGDNSELEFENE